jgi:hypothetical protein
MDSLTERDVDKTYLMHEFIAKLRRHWPMRSKRAKDSRSASPAKEYVFPQAPSPASSTSAAMPRKKSSSS